MPLILPDGLPAIDLLKEERIFISERQERAPVSERPLRVAVLNLMPTKVTTETDLIRLLSGSPLWIEVCLMKLRSHVPKHTPAEHMDKFYRFFDEMENEEFDGLIVTGAPVEHLAFEEVDYWNELCSVFDWAHGRVTSALYICWAAQAGLYHFYDIPKYQLPRKMFGVFRHRACEGKECLPLFRGLDDEFFVPHSRHTEVRFEDISRRSELEILSMSDEAGVHIVQAQGGKAFFVTGHSEYAPLALDGEYRRDLAKGLPIGLPANYYRDDNPSLGPVVRWRSTARLLFSNWMDYYVCPVL